MLSIAIVAEFAIMAEMATVHEKIVAMLATVRELRNIVAKIDKNDPVLAVISLHAPIAQKDLLDMLPEMSSRTARRKLDALVRGNHVTRIKKGKEVFYGVYPQKSA